MVPRELLEWHWSNALSAVARKGFRKGKQGCVFQTEYFKNISILGAYGRLDAHAMFKTTTTNMEPTAKQCWVLHPYVSQQS